MAIPGQNRFAADILMALAEYFLLWRPGSIHNRQSRKFSLREQPVMGEAAIVTDQILIRIYTECLNSGGITEIPNNLSHSDKGRIINIAFTMKSVLISAKEEGV
ncbi:hypothetical protein [Sphingobium sp. WCS2017Hpa-17]|uniref:hypothetical protein n=1 Tax=Sphingobium sp. WCS2017Hpa-17 TaxID=3073638 RepID=UPI0028890753|nr:hypothetical protein [Sphingobium sp. WCS2017Hpa-17]